MTRTSGSITCSTTRAVRWPICSPAARATSSLGSTSFLNGHSGAAVTQFTGAPISSTLGSAIGAGSGFTAAIGAGQFAGRHRQRARIDRAASTSPIRRWFIASNNKKAIIVSGQQIPVPTSTLSNLTSTGVVGSTAAVQSSINYLQVALQLEVVPLINSDREVNLDILQKLDSPSGTTTNVGGSNVPTISTRYIRTNVSVPNKATIVLGGLITKTVGGSNSQASASWAASRFSAISSATTPSRATARN